MIVRNVDNYRKQALLNPFHLLCPCFGIALAIFCFFSISEENRPVILPILTTIVTAAVFLWVLRLRNGSIPIFEIGMIYLAVVVLYTLYPLAGYIINGCTYTAFNDNRLFYAQPTPEEIGTLGWYHVIHLVSFVVVYLLVRIRLPRGSLGFKMPDRTSFLILVGLYLMITLFSLFLSAAYGFTKVSYIESYLLQKGLPFGLAQVAGLLSGARLTVELAILACLFNKYRKYWVLIFAWLGWIALETYIQAGSRTEFVMLVIAAAMMYHYLVRRIRLVSLAIGGFLLLTLFVSYGLLRMGWFFSETTEFYNPFAYAGEFEVIFANAYDFLYRLSGTAIELPPGFYLTDLVTMIPRQLLPFDKISLSEWYVNIFYPTYADMGGGLAFGTISESILGGGWLDLVIRGAALGLILAQIHRFCLSHRPSFWIFVFYVWLSVQMYQSFRHTTFFPAYLFVYRFFWVMAGTKILAFILKRGTGVQARIQTQPV